MNLRLLFIGFLPFLVAAQVRYSPDILGAGFQQATIQQPSDYEGNVTCTLIKGTAIDSSKKAVLYIHGFNDYFFQQEMAVEFQSKGYRFYALDLRKYGRSILPHQKMNNVRDLAEYFPDIDTALRIMRSEGCAQILLSGHSTGGLITTLYANHALGKELFDLLFLNSPFFDMNLKPFVEKRILPILVNKGSKKPNKTMKGGFSELYGWSLHKSKKGEWDYNLVWKPHAAPAVNYGWLRAIVEGQRKIHAGIKISKPVLVMHSDKSIYAKSWSDKLFTGDAVLSASDIHQYAKKIYGNTTIQTIPSGMHDLILSKPEVRASVYAHLFNWMVLQQF